jgi:hypothetical protein
MLLFLIQLFYALPHYIPKREPIVFSCILGEEIVKSIDLLNPTSKPISYWAKKEGHADFLLEGDVSWLFIIILGQLQDRTQINLQI